MSKKTRIDRIKKPRLLLLPLGVAKVYASIMEFGLAKRGVSTWLHETADMRINSALRHILQHLDGEERDVGSNFKHIEHAGIQLMLAVATLNMTQKEKEEMERRLAEMMKEDTLYDEQERNGIYKEEHSGHNGIPPEVSS